MRKLQNSNQLISRVWSTRECNIEKYVSLEVFFHLKPLYLKAAHSNWNFHSFLEIICMIEIAVCSSLISSCFGTPHLQNQQMLYEISVRQRTENIANVGGGKWYWIPAFIRIPQGLKVSMGMELSVCVSLHYRQKIQRCFSIQMSRALAMQYH